MLTILYQDKQIIVVNKSAGISVLPEGWDKNAPYLQKTLESKFGRIWIVHRLDKTTSGVIIFARTAEAHRDLNRQFEHKEVEKRYHAVVEGVPAWEEYTARHSLHPNVGRKHRTVVDRHRGKPSVTAFKLIKSWQAQAWIEAQPKTGRTHQIRVHLSALGYPILADTLYGAEKSAWIARPALHAHRIDFTHPSTKKTCSFLAPYPQDFADLLKKLDHSSQ